jgi:F-type H+-transporting ATPase subunit gamma
MGRSGGSLDGTAMSGATVREHLRLLEALRKIVAAMRTLAYAEIQRLTRIAAAQAQAQQVLLQAFADLSPEPAGPVRRVVWLAIGAERGFCGGFNERMADALVTRAGLEPQSAWRVAGDRLGQRVEPRLASVTLLPGCSAADEGAERVDEWIAHLLQDGPLSDGALQLNVLYQTEHGPVEWRLLPLPDLPPRTRGPAPLRQLPDEVLVSKMTVEWLRIGLLGALFQSLLQENRWRLAQMQRAQDHLDEAGEKLRRSYFRQRQNDITSELAILMSSLNILGDEPA